MQPLGEQDNERHDTIVPASRHKQGTTRPTAQHAIPFACLHKCIKRNPPPGEDEEAVTEGEPELGCMEMEEVVEVVDRSVVERPTRRLLPL